MNKWISPPVQRILFALERLAYTLMMLVIGGVGMAFFGMIGGGVLLGALSGGTAVNAGMLLGSGAGFGLALLRAWSMLRA